MTDKITSETTTEILKTRTDIIKAFGEPISETMNKTGFFAKLLAEDCFLIHAREYFDTRLVFTNKIVYLDADDNVMRIF